jgi:hypothetical protein
MAALLYLNIDGVLHPRAVTFENGRAPTLRSQGSHRLFEHVDKLEDIFSAYPDTTVVLHSWWPYIVGYRQTLELLPHSLRIRVIGSTLPGNRILRFHSKAPCIRREWLRHDVRRRMPEHPVVLDSEWSQVLPELADSTIVVPNDQGLAAKGVFEDLVRKIAIDDRIGTNMYP